MSLRRVICTILLSVALVVTTWQVGYHRWILDDVGGVGFFGVLIIFALAAGLLFWKVNRLTMVLGIALGALGATFIDDVVRNISWLGVLWASLAILVYGILFVLICLSDEAWNRMLRSLPRPSSNGDSDGAPGPRAVSQSA